MSKREKAKRNQRSTSSGFTYLGLLAILAIYVLRRKCDSGQLGNNHPNMEKPLQNNTPQVSSQQQDSIDKLDSIKKEIELGTYIAISALALVVMTYAISIIYKNVLQGFVGVVIALMMLMMSSPNNRKWITKSNRRFKLLFYSVMVILIIIVVLSIRFVFVIPT